MARPRRRWITLLVTAWLSLVLAGREHALAAVGLEVACVHPGATSAHPDERTHGGAAEPHAERLAGVQAAPDARALDASAADDGEGDDPLPGIRAADVRTDADCPVDCAGCPCGAAPCAPSEAPSVRAPRLEGRDLEGLPTSEARSRACGSVERPPRRARSLS